MTPLLHTYNFYEVVWPLLNALDFQGDERTLIDAAPHLLQHLHINDLCEFMAHLGYKSQKKPIKLTHLPPSPGIFVTKDRLFFVKKSTDTDIELLDLSSKETMIVPRTFSLKGDFYFFFSAPPITTKAHTWMEELTSRFKKNGLNLFFIGLLNAAFGLTVPLFVRSVFDWALPSKSLETLDYLLVGLGIALFLQHLVHAYQNKALAYMGARLSMMLTTSIMTKLLKLPYAMVEGASVPDQISRIKQFEGVKEFFVSPMAQLVMEGPFVIFFLIVLGILGGPLVFVPLVLILLFIILGAIIFPMMRKSTQLTTETYTKKFSFMVEAFSKINTLKFLGVETMMAKRFEEQTYNQSKASEHCEVLNAYATNLSQILLKIAGLVTIVWGATRVMDGLMTTGSLVAVVLLIWRALSPLQSAFMLFSQLDLTLSTLKQINQFMSIPAENYSALNQPTPKIQGYLYCESIGFRYPHSTGFSLHGITLEARPGEIVAIIGDNASGKSTLLKLLMGLYIPTMGRILLDHYETRHLPVNFLRKSIAYVPQGTQFFHGTIEQNLLLAKPNATDNHIRQACEKALVWEDIMRLSDGLQTRLGNDSNNPLNTGFQQKLSLARAYLQDCPVMILDEPGSNLDLAGDEWLKKMIQQDHGKTTTILVTHRPSIVHLSDRLLVLEGGRMKFFGPTAKVLDLMKEEKIA